MFDPLIGFVGMAIMQGPIKGIWQASTRAEAVVVAAQDLLAEDGQDLLAEDGQVLETE
jgi:hypothetical protein